MRVVEADQNVGLRTGVSDRLVALLVQTRRALIESFLPGGVRPRHQPGRACCRATESLLTVPFDVSEWGPVRPDEVITLADLDPTDTEAATQVSGDAGIQPGRGFEECVFDVAFTGDLSWAEIEPSAARAPMYPSVVFTAAVDVSVEYLLAPTDTPRCARAAIVCQTRPPSSGWLIRPASIRSTNSVSHRPQSSIWVPLCRVAGIGVR